MWTQFGQGHTAFPDPVAEGACRFLGHLVKYCPTPRLNQVDDPRTDQAWLGQQSATTQETNKPRRATRANPRSEHAQRGHQSRASRSSSQYGRENQAVVLSSTPPPSLPQTNNPTTRPGPWPAWSTKSCLNPQEPAPSRAQLFSFSQGKEPVAA